MSGAKDPQALRNELFTSMCFALSGDEAMFEIPSLGVPAVVPEPQVIPEAVEPEAPAEEDFATRLARLGLRIELAALQATAKRAAKQQIDNAMAAEAAEEGQPT